MKTSAKPDSEIEEMMEEYIESHTSAEPTHLKEIARESGLRMVHGRMCSGHLQGRLLKMIVQMIRPKRILELGAFTGYSALCMAEGLEEGGDPEAEIVSLEANDEYEEMILENLSKAECGKRVRLVIGEAEAEMAKMSDSTFDMIFIDADKRRYSAYYKEAMRLLRPGGYILADNTLWDGHVVGAGHKDSQTRGVMEFNEVVAQDIESEQLILPLRDGLTLIRKKK